MLSMGDTRTWVKEKGCLPRTSNGRGPRAPQAREVGREGGREHMTKEGGLRRKDIYALQLE